MSSDGAAVWYRTQLTRRGVMLVIASPSGAGKSTLSRLLLETDRDLSMSVSVTTRPRRASEVDGVHYRFLSERQFQLMRDGGELIEWAQVHGNFYGTPREPVEQALAEGSDVLFDIDYQGTLQLYDVMRSDIVSVFVLPPSGKELRHRIERRAEDKPETIRRRLATAVQELEHWHHFDYVIVNEDLNESFVTLQSILRSARHARSRQIGLESFASAVREDVRQLLSE